VTGFTNISTIFLSFFYLFSKIAKNCQKKVVKNCPKIAKSCQKIVKKVVKKLSKVAKKSCQKVVKKVLKKWQN
jgi:flagellar biosynthesis/type III secretory pathway protein FliH